MSLFGATQSKPSLFGNTSSTNNQQQSNGGGLFGQSTQPAQQQQQSGGGLFGQSTQPQQQQSNSLFGQPQPQQQSNSLFGQPQQQNQSSGLFGQPQQQQNSLFGGQQNQQPQQSNSLFGNTQSQQQPQQTTSLFGQPQQQQQQQQQPSNSLFGTTQNRSIWQPSMQAQPREKTIPDQMQTLLDKWSPDSPSCLFQQYMYNSVRPEQVPYYGPGPGEDEAKWEEALAKKPREDSIPVLCKGFAALGNRLKVQVQAVNALQARLHEVNNSLTAILQMHDLELSVRTNDAKRRHVALSQRSLQLATKIQVLRNRGYALDGAEEGLRKKLMELERRAFDPRLNGRQEEIWARMVGLRDRARFLQEETERAGKALSSNSGEGIDEEILKRTKKILGDYDSQISHLSREMEGLRKDFQDWEGGPSQLSS